MNRQTAHNRRLLAALICTALTIAGATWYLSVWRARRYEPTPPFAGHRALAAFAEHGVQVELALEQDAHGAVVLAGTFAPLKPDEHLYSSELPRAGLSGAGRPTLLELPTQSAAYSIGPLIADKPITLDPFPALNTTFPIYPDGPVTMRLPIALAGDATQITVQVTYMACSSTGYCRPPVEQKPLVLDLTQHS